MSASVYKWPETPTVLGVIHLKIANDAHQIGWQHQLKYGQSACWQHTLKKGQKRPVHWLEAVAIKGPETLSTVLGSIPPKMARNAYSGWCYQHENGQ